MTSGNTEMAEAIILDMRCAVSCLSPPIRDVGVAFKLGRSWSNGFALRLASLGIDLSNRCWVFAPAPVRCRP